MIPYQYVAIREITSAGAVVQTLELTDNVEYVLQEYTLGIAARNPSLLGEAYLETTDQLLVDVVGDTAALALNGLMRLLGLVEQAGRWDDGEETNPVEIVVEVQGGAALVGNLLLGPGPGQPPGAVAPRLDTDLTRWIIKDVSLSVRRRARLLGPRPTVADQVTASAVNPNPATLTFADSAALLRPAWVYAGFSQATSTNRAAYLAVSRPGGIIVTDVSTLSGGQFSTVADATNLPYQGTNVLRYTPLGANVIDNTVGGLGPIGGVGRRQWAVYAAVRNNSATRTFMVSVYYTETNGPAGVLVPLVEVDTSSTRPRMVFIGVIPIAYQIESLQIAALATTLAGSGTLDISYLVLVDLNDPVTRVIYDPGRTPGATRAIVARAAETIDELQSVGGTATAASVTAVINGVQEGNPSVQSLGGALSVALFGTRITAWVLTDAAVARATITYYAARRAAYLTPPLWILPSPPPTRSRSRCGAIGWSTVRSALAATATSAWMCAIACGSARRWRATAPSAPAANWR